MALATLRSRAALLPHLTCALALLVAPVVARAADAPYRVMLQGASADALRELAGQAGAEVTHYLPIINAIGALATDAQMALIRRSSAVSRIIDDLDQDHTDEEHPGGSEQCTIGGALELQRAGGEISWRLYNKGAQAASPARLQATWPGELGDLSGVTLGSQPLPFTAQAGESAGKATIEASVEAAVAAGSSALLTLRFSADVNTGAFAQQQFSLSADFGDDCTVELIPGYENNAGDTYYPSVTGADLLHRNGITGRGVTVAVLDSGLWEDSRLTQDTTGANRVLARYDSIADREDAGVFDESGHGTHMTSILAQSSPVVRDGKATGSFKGIAPDVGLVVVKAFGLDGEGDFLDIVRGLQWILNHREEYGIRVLNLSFAARPRWPYWLDPINQAIMRLWQAGIVAVAAAGNEGPDPMTIGSPGNLPYIITVGAVTDSWTIATTNDDYVPDFSSRGPTPSAHIKPDLVAPGGHMAGLSRPGSALTEEFPEYLLSTGDFVMTGTSQAAALVSGLTALLLQLEPDTSPDDIKCKFMSSADPAINADGRLSYTPFSQGSGYISLHRAITLGESGCGNPGLNIEKDIAGLDHYSGPAIFNPESDPTLPGLESMVASEASEEGISENRRWGVKAHIERDATAKHSVSKDGGAPEPPFDWVGMYLEERRRMQSLREVEQPSTE